MSGKLLRCAPIAATIGMAACSTSFAYLGGFETADGYQAKPVGGILDNYLNHNYNAGQYGTNNGGPGGSYATIPTNSGQWVDLATTNNGYDTAAPDGNHTPGGQWCCDFRGGNFSNFRPGSNSVDGNWTYNLDNLDLNGTAPLSINNNKIVQMSFYYLGGVAYAGDSPGTFRMGVRDGSGNLGLGFGVDDNSFLEYKDAAGSHSTTVFANGWNQAGHPWIYVRMVMNLATDTYDLGVTTGVPSGVMESDVLPPAIWLTTGAPMSAPMSNLAQLEFYVDAETGSQTGSTGAFNSNKQLLDDFNFIVSDVPEPTAICAAMFAATHLFHRRRRQAVD